MSAKKTTGAPSVLRQHAEDQFADELAAIAAADERVRPPNWKLSPWGVITYLLGGKLESGVEISPKYIGNRRLMWRSVASGGDTLLRLPIA